MHERIDKFQKILERDLEKKLDEVISAGTVYPDDLVVIDKATDVMLDLLKYKKWTMDESEKSII